MTAGRGGCWTDATEALVKTMRGRPEAAASEFETRTFQVRPLNPVIDAEIEGVDLSRPIGEDRYAELRAVLSDRHVLVFRNQALTRDDHKRFDARFGELHVHPYHARIEARAPADRRACGSADPCREG